MIKRLVFSLCFISAVSSCLADYQITIPGDSSALIANQVNTGTNLSAGGLGDFGAQLTNSLVNVFGNQLPVFSMVAFWDCCDASPTNDSNACYSFYLYDPTSPDGFPSPLWYEPDDATPADPVETIMYPGRGVLLVNAGGQTITLTFHGTPNIPVLPVDLPCGVGHYNLLGCQTNEIGTYENVTGLTPQEGAQVLRGNPANLTTYTFTSGAWTPSTPTLNIGEAAFFLVPPTIASMSYSPVNQTVTITWTGSGVLQQADQSNGPWADMPDENVSPCTLPQNPQATFYRVRCN